ncbi:hypothetical protein P4493_05475 [Bacillus thuringiensis]|jgi:hypothetical protein|uniref:Uncharacterized protein n=3 Tax=Bacillus thuringiensis TaxID=1428 RepID=A0A0B5N8Y6_BACTU|nr:MULTISPECIES: hypothetical protein [Bacillus]EAO56483.1 hypothetical protein RBTH_07458 [Bacillus thuringiensis serovar israelensis ATCC 35646]MEC3431536.1 hypothetical protein [Bacillus cereus]MED1153553.1 hypothetical protein [Bacillus paranthracis]OUB09157.1 hypothetical protein BK708_31965 [Bacillus thuringiensis serovar yunnanensis]AFQ29880.1 hypothetical protein BTF1_28897 [Bacillus thuringiensis HD-789]
MNENEFYKPVVPEWVAKILEKKKRNDPLATIGHSKEWENWKRKYPRKYKYAMLNGWIVEEK